MNVFIKIEIFGLGSRLRQVKPLAEEEGEFESREMSSPLAAWFILTKSWRRERKKDFSKRILLHKNSFRLRPYWKLLNPYLRRLFVKKLNQYSLHSLKYSKIHESEAKFSINLSIWNPCTVSKILIEPLMGKLISHLRWNTKMDIDKNVIISNLCEHWFVIVLMQWSNDRKYFAKSCFTREFFRKTSMQETQELVKHAIVEQDEFD